MGSTADRMKKELAEQARVDHLLAEHRAVPVVRPEPTTPYDRLVERLTGPHRCQHCGRTDPLTPAGVAEMVGLSETSVRRLMSADAGPSLRAVATMATTLDVPVTTLLGELWPALAQPAP